MLNIGDLIYFKDYFCEVEKIEVLNGRMYVTIHRKYRENGTPIKSKWKFRCLEQRLYNTVAMFENRIKHYEKLLQTFRVLQSK